MRVGLVLLACTLIFTGCGELAPKTEEEKPRQTTAEKLTPSMENTFELLMTKSGHNINYILYGLLNYDEVKIQRGTKNLMEISRFMVQNLPSDVMQDPEEKEKWKAVYQKQRDIAENLNFRFEELDYKGARKELKKLLKNCMACHKELGGLPKAEITFVGSPNPSMDHSLTEVMDSNNINFDELLFGLIAHDMDGLETALDNMKRAGSLIMAKIPGQHQAHKQKWDSHCEDQRKVVAKLRTLVKTEKDDEIWDTVQELLKVCMDCHKLYKPGIN